MMVPGCDWLSGVDWYAGLFLGCAGECLGVATVPADMEEVDFPALAEVAGC